MRASFLSRLASTVLAAAMLTGCYHAQVVADPEPSLVTVEKAWAHSFIGGLVPPAELNVADTCTNGVHRVETKLSFLNLVASAVTLGLYTPMSIVVTCAPR